MPAPPPPPSDVNVNAHRAALEALFAPKSQTPEPAAAKRDSAKIVVSRAARIEDPRDAERQKLLGKLLAAEGRAAVTKACEAFLRAGFTLPVEQEVNLQILEHTDEARVCEALEALMQILETEAPKRKAVLEARLRRLEDSAEDAVTRELTSALRRKVSGRG